jgi:hypothetical protein
VKNRTAQTLASSHYLLYQLMYHVGIADQCATAHVYVNAKPLPPVVVLCASPGRFSLTW